MNRYGLVEVHSYNGPKQISVVSTNKTFVSNIVHEIENKCVVKKLEDHGNDYAGNVQISFERDSEFATLYICDNGWEPYHTDVGRR